MRHRLRKRLNQFTETKFYRTHKQVITKEIKSTQIGLMAFFVFAAALGSLYQTTTQAIIHNTYAVIIYYGIAYALHMIKNDELETGGLENDL